MNNVLSSHVTFIFIALYTIQIVSNQLFSDKQENIDSVMQTEFNSAVKQLSKDNNKWLLFIFYIYSLLLITV